MYQKQMRTPVVNYENEKGEKKASDEGRISLRFVREINPEDYFGAKK